MRRNNFVAGLVTAGIMSVSLLSMGAAQTKSSYSDLRQGFARPPQSARLRCYWWWLNGNTDEATITNDLEQMARMGFGGALLVDANGSNQNGNIDIPAGPTFASPEWTKLYVHALHEADRLGLEISLNITSGWNLGGPGVTPEQASKLLTWSRSLVTGGHFVSMSLSDPASKNGFYREIAVLAYPLHHGAALPPQINDHQGDRHTDEQGVSRADPLRFRSAAAESGFSMPDASSMLNAVPNPTNHALADTSLSEVRDLSAQVHEGRLQWDAPAGDWEVLRIGYTDSNARVSTGSGKWQGLAIDYMDHTAFDSYWKATVEPLLSAGKPYVGRSLKYLVSDSWELGGTNWTANFREQFTQLRGYDPLLYLPVVAGRIVDDRDTSTRFLTDLRRTVADLIVSEHYDVFSQHARQYGLGVHPESGGPHGAPIDALETFRSSAFAQTEYWAPNAHRSTDVDRFFTKEGASAANIYGLAFNAQEGMTSIGPQWSESLATELKPAFDQALTEGMTRLIWHEWTSSPRDTGLPGQEYFAGTHMNPKVTWWPASQEFFAYLNRAQFLLQQGTPVDDALYFYGDNVPNFVRVKSDDPAKVLPGYDYDVTNEDALLHRIKINSGQLVGPGGVTWRVLMMPKTRRVSISILQQVQDYVKAGGVVAGLSPTSPTGKVTSEIMTEFDHIVDAVWQGCSEGQTHHFGKGTVYCETEGNHVLQAMRVAPDFNSDSAKLDYVHRREGDTEIYFVRNGTADSVMTKATFRVGGKTPELWNALTGEITPAENVSSQASNLTSVSLRLAPYGSVFVVFRSGHAGMSPRQIASLSEKSADLNGPWQIQFQMGRGAPPGEQKVGVLRSWSESDVPGIRYFSGSAVYTTHFNNSSKRAGGRTLLRLADVHEIARVRLNGQYAGTIWARPFELRIDRWLKSGDNKLEIEVTNLWPNRIIGDLQPGTKVRYTRTNITKYKEDSRLLPSGLIGPVSLVYQNRSKLAASEPK